MKKTVLTAYVALLLCFLMPLALPERSANAAAQEIALPPAEETPEADGEADAPEAAAMSAPSPAAQTIRLLVEGEVRRLDMEDYLFGVLAAEMPASFPDEALKAQAVAARTYALYCAAGHKHTDADLCADPGCCQAWQDEASLWEKWGESFDPYAKKLRAAVAATAGQYLAYEGEPVFAAFHSSSAGATEASAEVWNARPYLVSVSSPETAETVPNFESLLICAPLDFRDTILSLYPKADFTGDEASWVGELTRDESGRVASAVIGGVTLRGTELRSLFSLRSTAFTLRYEDGRFVFDVLGYGHGVGMSQYGAKLLAEGGADYTAILDHYYPGTTLVGSF